jgi:hypothetical protein
VRGGRGVDIDSARIGFQPCKISLPLSSWCSGESTELCSCESFRIISSATAALIWSPPTFKPHLKYRLFCRRSAPAAVPHRTSARQQRCAVRQAASRLCAPPGTFRWPAAFTGSGCSSPARVERVHARQAAGALRHVALVRNRRAQVAW